MNYFRSGDIVRFVASPLTRRLNIIGKYGTVIVGSSRLDSAKIMTPTKNGLMALWFPYTTLKLCTPKDPRPKVGTKIVFTDNHNNRQYNLVGTTGTIILNMPESPFSHVKTDTRPDHCAHFTEITPSP